MNYQTENTKKSSSQGFYKAHLEDGELCMTPFCACGNPLDEDYYCEKCGCRCRCYRIICHDPETLELVKDYIRKSPQFSVYRAELADEEQ